MNRHLRLLAIPIVILMLASFAVRAAEVQEGIVVAARNNGLAMTDLFGENARTYLVAPIARITHDGNRAKLEDLRNGDRVVVTMRQQDRQNKVVIRADAHSVG
jgi:hypothetical protein